MADETQTDSQVPTESPATQAVEQPAVTAPAGDAGGADGAVAGEGDKSAASGAPEKYEDFKLPEGVTLEAEVAGEIAALGKELNLPQEQAQKVADLIAKSRAAADAQVAETLKTTRETWLSEAKADKEFGGDKLGENLATAKRAIDTFASPRLKEVLDATGFGNHPEVIRFAVNVGRAISPDKLVTGGAPGKARLTDAEVFYGSKS